jgi:hypothetical protein
MPSLREVSSVYVSRVSTVSSNIELLAAAAVNQAATGPFPLSLSLLEGSRLICAMLPEGSRTKSFYIIGSSQFHTQEAAIGLHRPAFMQI